ncbi:MAG: putative quinol monooxygenase [Fimbriimonas sp.]
MVILIASGRLKTERRAEALEVCQGMLEPSRAEEGCISYSFFTDPHDPDSLIFVEEWKSREAIDLHFSLPHFIDFSGRMADLVQAPFEIHLHSVSDSVKL